jgi:hypothetical protein
MATKSWANILNEENASKPVVATAATIVKNAIPADVKREEEAMLRGFTVPDLAKRSDITAHFPVMLFKHEDGPVKRFTVTLDGRRFKDMKADEKNEEAREDFEYYTLWRLVYALRKRSDLYTIERPPAMAFAFILALKPAPASDAMPLSTHDFMEKKGLEEPRVAHPSEYNEVLNNESSVYVKPSHNGRNKTRKNNKPAAGSRAAIELEIREINRIVPIVWANDEGRGIFLLDVRRNKLDPMRYPSVADAKRKLREVLEERTAACKLKAYAPKGSDSGHDGVVSMTM